MTLRNLVPQKLNTQIVILGAAVLLALPTGMAKPPEARALPAERGSWQEQQGSPIETPTLEATDGSTPTETPTETPPPIETSDETSSPAETPVETPTPTETATALPLPTETLAPTPTETAMAAPLPNEVSTDQYPPGQWATIIENQEFTQPLQLEAGNDNTLLLNVTFRDISGSALLLSNVSNIYIKNCTIYNVAEAGILLRAAGSAHNVTIDGCTIYNTGRSGILAEAEGVDHPNLVIKNNTLHNNGTAELGHGIYVSSTDSLIENNMVYGSSGNGISLSSSGIVRGNRVWDTQGSCIGYHGDHPAGASNALYIENNVCYQTSSGLGRPGIGLSTGEQVAENWPVQNYYIRFNTVALATADRYGFMGESPGLEPKHIELYGNLFVNTGSIFKTIQPQYVDRMASNYNTTYLEEFVNPTQPPYDFQLVSASLARAYASAELQFPATDINGNVRTGGALDAGAYQSSLQAPSAPTPTPILAPVPTETPAPVIPPTDIPASEIAPIDAPASELAPIDAPASDTAPTDAPVDSSTHDHHSMMAMAAAVGDSHALGLWSPTSRDTCTKAQHDAYFVVGPDGKKYPTWHPPTGPGGCTFGHEHGRNPRQSPNWPKIQEYFAYDANQNGTIENTEKDQAGVPFGYVNEQLDIYNGAIGTGHLMRHEDHVGHKIEWEAQGDVRIHTGPGDMNIRVVAKCNYFAKVHQGTHSKDAFNNNLHEVFALIDCPGENYDIRIAKMVVFGAAGEFSKSPPCSPRGGIQTVGFEGSNPDYPGSRSLGAREIGHRECANQNFLVPQGKFSTQFYEIWIGNTSIWLPSGQALVRNPVPQFAVFNPIRFYDPGKPNNLGYLIDLCYETEANGDKARGIPCDQVQKNPRIAWDDPASVFTGTKRETYFQAGLINNANGPLIWYTDPYGANAQRTPFPGSVKQYIINKKIDLGAKYKGVVDTSAYGANRSYAGNGVHAPN